MKGKGSTHRRHLRSCRTSGCCSGCRQCSHCGRTRRHNRAREATDAENSRVGVEELVRDSGDVLTVIVENATSTETGGVEGS